MSDKLQFVVVLTSCASCSDKLQEALIKRYANVAAAATLGWRPEPLRRKNNKLQFVAEFPKGSG